MNPEYVRSDSEVANRGWKWKQMGDEEKKAAINEEMKRMQRLPPNSSYVSHRLRVLNKIQQLISLQVGVPVSLINYECVM
ncbi:hypothetical protein CDL12_27493 [Handroanthus impetiginosus]|uniref:Uncharacterized protein n=1 Tax=Handroanthus impetiginosus TaxID=429701 RepID=A0A2G9G514_9LAMI|nr:hypothetical protein CDL12_27493 [Handroanthus impetiginosus]